ncbi:hypothetical protein ABZW30_17465 [Kitasatospora sp. NPDC004669]|uniref:hypothetical protein n=1 Tax=Kitasatospora sp. NPDC004669 TaxID=3154555 RepID=UPI0033B4041A
MNLRTKKTLSALLKGAIVLTCSTLYRLARGWQLVVDPVFFAFVALFLASAGYTWWWYGDSPKAVAMRANVEAKKAARQQLR